MQNKKTAKRGWWPKAVNLILAVAFSGAAQANPYTAFGFTSLKDMDLTQANYMHNRVPGLYIEEGVARSLVAEAADMYRRHRTQMQDPVKRRVVQDFIRSFEPYRYSEGERLLSIVNRSVNLFVPYQTDKALYRRNEKYATPYETIMNRSGDCEDIAVLKYFTLVGLGVPEQSLRLTNMLVEGDGHTNLLAETGDGKKFYLDNENIMNLIPVSEHKGILGGLYNFSAAGQDLLSESLKPLWLRQFDEQMAHHRNQVAGITHPY